MTEVGQYIIDQTKEHALPITIAAAAATISYSFHISGIEIFSAEFATSLLQQGVQSMAAGRSMLPVIAGSAAKIGSFSIGGGKMMMDSFWNIPWYGKSAIFIGSGATGSYVYVKGLNQTAHDVTKVIDFVADTTKQGVNWISTGSALQMGALVVGAYATSVILNQGGLSIFKSAAKKRAHPGPARLNGNNKWRF